MNDEAGWLVNLVVSNKQSGLNYVDALKVCKAYLVQSAELTALRSEIEALRRVREAAKRCYPTLIGHMIHCAVSGRSDCDCGKYENDKALGQALTAANTGILDAIERECLATAKSEGSN